MKNLKQQGAWTFYKTDARYSVIGYMVPIITYFATPFNGEFAFAYMAYGTDEFHVGGDNFKHILHILW